MFAALYLTEGAPIGFIWLGLPTRLRALDLPLENITWLLALLILPWTFKFLWAPVIDLLRGPRWGFRHWILTSQSLMVLTLLPLFWLDLQQQFWLSALFLFAHASAAATQDVAIDALCISNSQPEERASLNGWMQCGMLTGRACLGGGSLILEDWFGYATVIGVLIGIVAFSAIFVAFSRENLLGPATTVAAGEPTGAWRRHLLRQGLATATEMWRAVGTRAAWIGLAFAAVAPAAFKSLEAVIGPYLLDRHFSQVQIGQFTATVMIGAMILGSLSVERLAGRLPGRRWMGVALLVNVASIALLASTDLLSGDQAGVVLLILLALVAFTIGIFTVSLYSWLMNLTRPALAATQFTTFMAATNACEAWSTGLFGHLQTDLGYPVTMLILCGLSLAAGLLLISETGSTLSRQTTSVTPPT